MSTSEIPVVTPEQHGTRTTHPAFGCITLSKLQVAAGSKGMHIFGSAVDNPMSLIEIEIRKASEHQTGSQTYTLPEQTICSVVMTHAQFAQFITSAGDGAGTPVTIRHAPEGYAVDVPSIDRTTSAMASAVNLVKASAQRSVDQVASLVKDLEAMLADGKGGTKAMKEAVRSLRIHVDNLPSNIAHAVKTGEESIEESVSAAKIEIEAFAATTSMRHGITMRQDDASVQRIISHTK